MYIFVLFYLLSTNVKKNEPGYTSGSQDIDCETKVTSKTATSHIG